MPLETVKTVTSNMQYKNFTPPVNERQLGWNAYANRMPIEICTTDAMRRGWLAANRAEAYANTSQVRS